MGRTGKDVSVFVGNSAFPILATEGGLVEHLVRLNDKVVPGQKVAIQRNSFGEVVAEYTSRVAGEVTGQRSDAMASPATPWCSSCSTRMHRIGARRIPSDNVALAAVGRSGCPWRHPARTRAARRALGPSMPERAGSRITSRSEAGILVG